DGFNMQNAVRAARAQLEAARASLKIQEENTVSEVWDAFHNYQTAQKQLVASNSLFTSATESFNASSARYKLGAADIVELLNAQSVLASARAQVITSRTSISTSYAELLHAVGSTLPPAASEGGNNAAE
ncbi:MAG: TolC family protein, partial [bacterium]